MPAADNPCFFRDVTTFRCTEPISDETKSTFTKKLFKTSPFVGEFVIHYFYDLKVINSFQSELKNLLGLFDSQSLFIFHNYPPARN